MEFGPPARIVGTAGSRVVGLTWTSTSESSSVANALVVTTAMNVRVFDVVHGCVRPAPHASCAAQRSVTTVGEPRLVDCM